MRVLVIAPSPPFPVTYGAAARTFNIVKELSKQHKVWLLTYSNNGNANSHSTEEYGRNAEVGKLDPLAEYCEIIPPVARSVPSRLRKRLHQLTSAFGLASYARREFYREEMQNAINEVIRDKRIDAVHVESSFMGYFKFGDSLLKVLDEHNVEYQLLYRVFKTERNPLRKLYNFSEWIKFRRDEIAIARRFDTVFYPSEVDARIMRPHLGNRVAVLPNGVDTNFFSPREGAERPNTLLFFGAMNYYPNVDAMLYFANLIWPRIKQRAPEATLNIMGPNPPKIVRDLAAIDGIGVLGKVDDPRSLIASATVVVVPLRIGSGTRLKVLEALAMGKAIVSTSVGVEGIDITDKEVVLMADAPSKFADCVVETLNDSRLRAAMGRNGRALVESRYSWSQVCQPIQEVYRDA